MSDESYFTDEELSRLNINGLKNYLRRHGQMVTGRKEELFERAKGVRLTKIPDVDELRYNDLAEDQRQELLTSTTTLGETIPDLSQLKNWNSDLKLLPDFSEKDITNYFLYKLGSKIQTKVRSYFEDGHVYNIQYNCISEEFSHCVVRASVMPSLPSANKSKNLDHTTWVIASKDTGNVHAAQCNCTAG